jgi:cellulose synthase/poly-beta-1,6-N-acetylglucosamine synthase-like glycosyltransferase
VSIAVTAVATVLFLFSLPAVVELSLFLFSHIFLRPFFVKKAPIDGKKGGLIRLAILIPAHNEEKDIARCVAAVLTSETGGHKRDVIVIADNCDDTTAAQARSAGARVIERFDQDRRGKGAALDYAISLLMPEDHEAFVIIDADTIVSDNFVKSICDRFAEGVDALQCVNLPSNVEASRRIRLINIALLSMNVFRPMGRQMLGLSVGILGNGFGLSKRLLKKVPYTATSITEDLEYHLRLVEQGFKVRFVSDARVLSDFPVSEEGAATQRARWEGGRFMLQRKLFLPMLRRIISGRVSLAEPFLELMSLPLSYEVLILIALIALPLQPFALYGVVGIGIIAAQTLAAVSLYGTRRDLSALAGIPSYILWKIVQLPKTLVSSRSGSSWVRTKRD